MIQEIWTGEKCAFWQVPKWLSRSIFANHRLAQRAAPSSWVTDWGFGNHSSMAAPSCEGRPWNTIRSDHPGCLQGGVLCLPSGTQAACESWELEAPLPSHPSSGRGNSEDHGKAHPRSNKGPSSQGYGFSSGHVWMWEFNAFELWCWRRLLRVPWTARRSNQSILKEISPEYSLEGLMLKLKLQCFGHLMWKTDSFKKTLMLGRLKAGGEGDDRGWDGWMASLTQWTWVWASSGSWWWTGRPGVLQSMGSQKVGYDWVAKQHF